MHAHTTTVVVPFYGTWPSLKIFSCRVPHYVECTSHHLSCLLQTNRLELWIRGQAALLATG